MNGFTLYHADCVGMETNCIYPHKMLVMDDASLREAAARVYIRTRPGHLDEFQVLRLSYSLRARLADNHFGAANIVFSISKRKYTAVFEFFEPQLYLIAARRRYQNLCHAITSTQNYAHGQKISPRMSGGNSHLVAEAL